MQFTTFAAVLALAATSTALEPRVYNPLSARGDGEIICKDTDHVAGPAPRDSFGEGHGYLKKLGNACGVDAGKCSRVSCSNDGAVYLCDDDGKGHSGVDCGTIADYVYNIFDQCQVNGQWQANVADGTQSNSDGWHVEVGYDSC